MHWPLIEVINCIGSLNWFIENWFIELIQWIDPWNWFIEVIHWIDPLNWFIELMHWIYSLDWFTELVHWMGPWNNGKLVIQRTSEKDGRFTVATMECFGNNNIFECIFPVEPPFPIIYSRPPVSQDSHKRISDLVRQCIDIQVGRTLRVDRCADLCMVSPIRLWKAS